jgi:hypothetical protein
MTVANDSMAQDPAERAADLVLARLHLRLGSLSLARAELEAMAGRNTLDDQGIRDLAEVRWRTGDLPGAAEAAGAYLASQPDDVVALVITAEMQHHLGRPGEARRLAGRALAAAREPIDAIFAGMPRSSVWPVDPGTSVEPAGTLFADLAAPSSWATSLEQPAESWPGAEATPRAADGPAPDQHGPGLWEDHAGTAAPVLPDPAELLARARDALEADRPGQAAAGLALAIRADPSLAPAVLDLLAGRPEPVLALVRGDAHRIVGHEPEALRDYAAAVAAIDLQRRSDRSGRMAEQPEGAAKAAGAAEAAVEPGAVEAGASREAITLEPSHREAAWRTATRSDEGDG